MTGSDKRKKECIVRSAVQWHYFRYCAMCEALRKHSEKGRGGGVDIHVCHYQNVRPEPFHYHRKLVKNFVLAINVNNIFVQVIILDQDNII